MKKICIFFLSFVLLLAAGCGSSQTKRYQAEFLTLFDTVTTIIGYAESEAEFTAIAGQIHADLEEYHQLYDIYKDYEGIPNLKTINDSAGQAPVPVDARILSMLEFAKEQYENTDGAVNVAMGSVFHIWHDYREAGLENPTTAALPPQEALQQAAGHADINDLILDWEASTVYLRDPAMRLDVGAVAKGYATEQVALQAQSRGISSLLLSVGGNVRAIGGKMQTDSGGSQSWTVSIQNPDKSSIENELMLLEIRDLSVVSSGIYERYYTVLGQQYHHVVDPETLMPANYFAQVTIVCPDSGLADALSTAVFCMPLQQGQAYIEQLADVEALWVMHDGSLQYSSGFDRYIK